MLRLGKALSITISPMKAYCIEAFATFTLALAVALSLAGSFPVSTPILAALVIGLFTYTVSHVSGAHLNPAITIGAWTLGKIDAKDAGGYIIAQFLGAAAAYFTAESFLPALTYFHAKPGTLTTSLAEFVGMIFFGFGFASVLYGRVSDEMRGFVVGGSFLLGVSIAFFAGSTGILNPAVAFALNSLNVAYLIGPIVGSIVGMWLYKLFATGVR
jgi:aquaporin Z